MDAHGRNLHEVWMELHQLLRSEYKAAVPEAVVSAFAVFLLTDGEFRNGIIYAGNFGRDSDTVGAVAGALAGAIGGLSSIPDDWIARVRRPSGTCLQFTAELDIVDVARRLSSLET
jgi:ADP-ribosylglycohydrolase